MLVTPPSPLPRHGRAQRVVGHDRVRKRRLYAEHALASYWLLDPAARTLEALRRDAATGAWIEVGSYDDASLARIAPFEGIEIEVGRFFPPR